VTIIKQEWMKSTNNSPTYMPDIKGSLNMTKPNYTHIVLVLDRSGSMDTVKDDAIGGFNQFLEEQKNFPGQATMTLAQFDHEYEILYDFVPIGHVASLSKKTFIPRGMTRLLDAVGMTIKGVGQHFMGMREEDRPSKVVFAILTDGHENDSREFNRAQVFEMIKHQEEKYSWQFAYLSSDMNAVVDAQSYGIPMSSTYHFTPNSGKAMKFAFSNLSASLVSYRSGADVFAFANDSVTDDKDNVQSQS
jgi:hypothetical protein